MPLSPEAYDEWKGRLLRAEDPLKYIQNRLIELDSSVSDRDDILACFADTMKGVAEGSDDILKGKFKTAAEKLYQSQELDSYKIGKGYYVGEWSRIFRDGGDPQKTLNQLEKAQIDEDLRKDILASFDQSLKEGRVDDLTGVIREKLTVLSEAVEPEQPGGEVVVEQPQQIQDKQEEVDRERAGEEQLQQVQLESGEVEREGQPQIQAKQKGVEGRRIEEGQPRQMSEKAYDAWKGRLLRAEDPLKYIQSRLRDDLPLDQRGGILDAFANIMKEVAEGGEGPNKEKFQMVADQLYGSQEPESVAIADGYYVGAWNKSFRDDPEGSLNALEESVTDPKFRSGLLRSFTDILDTESVKDEDGAIRAKLNSLSEAVEQEQPREEVVVEQLQSKPETGESRGVEVEAEQPQVQSALGVVEGRVEQPQDQPESPVVERMVEQPQIQPEQGVKRETVEEEQPQQVQPESPVVEREIAREEQPQFQVELTPQVQPELGVVEGERTGEGQPQQVQPELGVVEGERTGEGQPQQVQPESPVVEAAAEDLLVTGLSKKEEGLVRDFSGGIPVDGDEITKAIRERVLAAQKEVITKALVAAPHQVDPAQLDSPEKFRAYSINPVNAATLEAVFKDELVKKQLEERTLAGQKSVMEQFSDQGKDPHFSPMKWDTQVTTPSANPNTKIREQQVTDGGRVIHTLKESTETFNPAKKVKNSQGDEVEITKSRTIDLPDSIGRDDTMHVSLVLKDKDGKAPPKSKAVYFTAHYENGKLVEMSCPTPVKFGPEPDKLGYIEHDGQIYTIPVKKEKYDSMMRTIAQNKGQIQAVEDLSQDLDGRGGEPAPEIRTIQPSEVQQELVQVQGMEGQSGVLHESPLVHVVRHPEHIESLEQSRMHVPIQLEEAQMHVTQQPVRVEQPSKVEQMPIAMKQQVSLSSVQHLKAPPKTSLTKEQELASLTAASTETPGLSDFLNRLQVNDDQTVTIKALPGGKDVVIRATSAQAFLQDKDKVQVPSGDDRVKLQVKLNNKLADVGASIEGKELPTKTAKKSAAAMIATLSKGGHVHLHDSGSPPSTPGVPNISEQAAEKG